MKRYEAIMAMGLFIPLVLVGACSLITRPDRCLIPEDQREGDEDCAIFGNGGSTSSTGGGGSGGNGGSTTNTGGGGAGGTGGQGGSITSNGGGGAGGEGGTGGTGGAGGQGGSGGAGTGGMGGSGGSGGGPTCMDPPENNALNIACNMNCFKVLVWVGGMTINAESSNDDGLCESTQPFITHPLSGQYAMIWVNDPVNAANLDSFTAQSLGSYPSVCNIKCGPDPAGDAPNHTEMQTQLLNGGYTTVACGANPAVSLGQVCPFGMYAVLQFP